MGKSLSPFEPHFGCCAWPNPHEVASAAYRIWGRIALRHMGRDSVSLPRVAAAAGPGLCHQQVLGAPPGHFGASLGHFISLQGIPGSPWIIPGWPHITSECLCVTPCSLRAPLCHPGASLGGLMSPQNVLGSHPYHLGTFSCHLAAFLGHTHIIPEHPYDTPYHLGASLVGPMSP